MQECTCKKYQSMWNFVGSPIQKLSKIVLALSDKLSWLTVSAYWTCSNLITSEYFPEKIWINSTTHSCSIEQSFALCALQICYWTGEWNTDFASRLCVLVLFKLQTEWLTAPIVIFQIVHGIEFNLCLIACVEKYYNMASVLF